MVIGTDDNDVRGVVILRTGEVVDVVGLDNAVAILVTNLLAADLVAIVVEPLQGQDDRSMQRYFTSRCSSSIEAVLSAMKNWSSSLCS